MNLPGVCSGCRAPVVWTGRVWANPEGRKHRCRTRIVTRVKVPCGKWMPEAEDRCARNHGHRGYCRTRWAMDNALEAASGRRRVA